MAHNKIGPAGVQHIAMALQQNTVSSILSPSISISSGTLNIDSDQVESEAKRTL